MILSAVLQISSVLLAVLTLVWHQSRTVDRLRKEVRSDHRRLLKLHNKATRQARKDNERLRREFTKDNEKLRRDFTKDNEKLRRDFTKANNSNSRKLDRIEGFLGIGMPGMPGLAAGRVPGAAFGVSHPGREDPSAVTEDEPQERQPEDPPSEAGSS